MTAWDLGGENHRLQQVAAADPPPLLAQTRDDLPQAALPGGAAERK